MTDRAPDRRVRDHVDDPVGDTAQVTDARHRPQTHAEREARSPAKTRPITLALQGGGSHGAYTWGVLDRLLEDDRFGVEAVSGTSAGRSCGASAAPADSRPVSRCRRADHAAVPAAMKPFQDG